MNFAVVFPSLQFNVHVIAPRLAGFSVFVRDVPLVLLNGQPESLELLT